MNSDPLNIDLFEGSPSVKKIWERLCFQTEVPGHVRYYSQGDDQQGDEGSKLQGDLRQRES